MTPTTYQAIALKHGLKLYAATGIKPNRSWTPSAMLRTVSHFTGKAYKRGAYLEAAADLDAWLVTQADAAQAEG